MSVPTWNFAIRCVILLCLFGMFFMDWRKALSDATLMQVQKGLIKSHTDVIHSLSQQNCPVIPNEFATGDFGPCPGAFDIPPASTVRIRDRYKEN